MRCQILLCVALCAVGCGGGSPTANVSGHTSRLFAANVVQIENGLKGTPQWTLYKKATNGQIWAYANAVSVPKGGKIGFCVDTVDPTASVSYYRLGWYSGAGGRLLAGPIQFAAGPQNKAPLSDSRGLYDCNWSVRTTLSVPSDSDPNVWPSGYYLAKFTSGASGYQTFVPFVVTDSARASDFTYQVSFNTYQAYNKFGGLNYYYNKLGKRADAVSFNRPYFEGYGAQNLFNWDIDMIRFLEREGYDVTYTTDTDLHSGAATQAAHKGHLIVGHSEYWSSEMRSNLTNLLSQRVGIANFAADTCEWQVRYEPSSAGQANRTMVCYKTSYQQDPFYQLGIHNQPAKLALVATEFRGSVLNNPESKLFGVQYHANPVASDIVLTNTNTWVTAGTGATPGTHLQGLLGYETDAVGVGTPANTVVLASSIDGTGSANMALTPTPGGGLVFATGSMQWCWGLDAYRALTNVNGVPQPNPLAQQMTRNVLDHMKAL